MQNGGTSKPTGPIVAAIGGVLLALGSVMTWATASLNIDAFKTAIAQALGVDPSQIPIGSVPSTSKSFAGTSGSDGKIALVCGIIVLLLALVAWARPQFRVPVGVLAIVGGLVGGGLAVYDISKKGDIIAGAKETAAPALAQLGLPSSILDSAFKVSLGIGIYLCVVAGVLAVVGGLMILMQKSAAPVAASGGMATGSAAPPPPSDMGFGASPAAHAPPPSMPAAPAGEATEPLDQPTAPTEPPATPEDEMPPTPPDAGTQEGPSSS
jgi:hypothetical protein